jgi:N-acetyl-anhydromuramyl-L-alanine amidase AmpD
MSNSAQPGPLPTISREYRADANHYTRGRGPFTVPTDIIVHSSVGKDSRNWLTTTSPAGHEVSAHSLARGSVRYDLVNFMDTAYAAGACLPGISNANTLNLEIENLSGYVNADGSVVNQPYDEATLNTAAHCVAAWMFSYGIQPTRVHRHADVAVYSKPDPRAGQLGRKKDPVNLDWPAFLVRVQAWYSFFLTLPESQHAYYIQLSGPPPDPDPPPTAYEVHGPPTISLAEFTSWLTLHGSPAIVERPASEYYGACVKAGIDPNFALAQFWHESQCGTDGVARTTKSWGNLRNSRGHANGSVPGPFALYSSWLMGLYDWITLWLTPPYQGLDMKTALEIYAPSSDGNNPDAYYVAVQAFMAARAAASKGQA